MSVDNGNQCGMWWRKRFTCVHITCEHSVRLQLVLDITLPLSGRQLHNNVTLSNATGCMPLCYNGVLTTCRRWLWGRLVGFNRTTWILCLLPVFSSVLYSFIHCLCQCQCNKAQPRVVRVVIIPHVPWTGDALHYSAIHNHRHNGSADHHVALY